MIIPDDTTKHFDDHCLTFGYMHVCMVYFLVMFTKINYWTACAQLYMQWGV